LTSFTPEKYSRVLLTEKTFNSRLYDVRLEGDGMQTLIKRGIHVAALM
jgi:hypothetical protein